MDCSHVGMLGPQYKSVNFAAKLDASRTRAACITGC